MKENRSSLRIVPCTFRRAVDFIELHHRHHQPPRNSVINVAVVDESCMVRGVATANRPVSRHLDDGSTLEINRVATDGCPNACSALYGAIARAAKAMGFASLITYTLPTEGGASLRGAGWKNEGEAGGGSWSRPSRPREDRHPLAVKWRWRKNVDNDAIAVKWPDSLGEDPRQLTLME